MTYRRSCKSFYSNLETSISPSCLAPSILIYEVSMETLRYSDFVLNSLAFYIIHTSHEYFGCYLTIERDRLGGNLRYKLHDVVTKPYQARPLFSWKAFLFWRRPTNYIYWDGYTIAHVQAKQTRKSLPTASLGSFKNKNITMHFKMHVVERFLDRDVYRLHNCVYLWLLTPSRLSNNSCQ